MSVKIIQFAALIWTALALAPGAAHLFALPNKIGLAQDSYFITQAVYRGWALLGVFTLGAPLLNLLAAYAMRRDRAAALCALGAALCGIATLAVFFIWTFPTNTATNNWTAVPENWEQLRAQWEYSHAVNAFISLAALCLIAVGVIRYRAASP